MNQNLSQNLNQDIVVLVILFGVVIVIIGYILYFAKAEKKAMKNKFLRMWGKVPEREYEFDEYQSITRYFYNRVKQGVHKENYIDDITWNDLDMDNVYVMMNHTDSSLGQEYLYDLLRTPVQTKEEAEERERLIQFFGKNKEVRYALKEIFLKTGYTRKISISDYLEMLGTLPRGTNLPHYLSIVVLLLGISVLFVAIPIGVIAVIGAIFCNMALYYKRKGQIEGYVTTFVQILRILEGADGFDKIKVPEISEYVEKIIQAKKQLKKFRKGSFILLFQGGVLSILLDYIRILFHIDLIKFNQMLKEVQNHISEINIVIENMGFIESMIAIASFRKSLPYHVVPELTEGKKAYIKIAEASHPMIANPVPNSVTAERGILVTGSNASGKSTFLKTIAINAILAQTIHTVYAREYQASFFRIYSSMALTDNLKEKDSYYIVEIKSLKRILNHIDEERPVLCFVDEVLRGTNTVERIAASSRILESMAQETVICFAATHDIELTYLLEKMYDNYHFQEKIEENDVLFDYQLVEGRASSRNAIKLLQIIGYEEEIIKKAEDTASQFLSTGEWRL